MITGPQLRAARASLSWTPATLASKAMAAVSVVERAETALVSQ